MRPRRYHRRLWLSGGGKVLPWPLLCAKADLLVNTGSWERAMDIYRSCLPALEAIGDGRAVGQCLAEHGFALQLQGNYQEAGLMGEKALELGTSMGDHFIRAKALNLLGNLANSQGRLGSAVDYYLRALSGHISGHEAVDRCVVMKNLGVAYYEMGNYQDAVDCQRKALAYAEAGGRLSEIGAIYLNLGIIHQRQQNNDQALDYLNRSMVILRRIGLLHLETNVHNYFGIIYSNLGQVDKALSHYRITLKYSSQLGDQLGLASAYNNIGNIHLDRGRYEEASQQFNECLLLCRSMDHENGVAIAGFNLGEIYKELGDLAKADGLLIGSIDYARKQNARYLLCQFLAGFADLRMRQGRRAEAEEAARESLAMAEDINLPSTARSCSLLLARMAAENDLPSALARMEKLLAECADENDTAEISYRIFKLTGTRAHRQAALECYRRLDTDPENRLIKKKITELEQAF